jgi:hypothetical protein
LVAGTVGDPDIAIGGDARARQAAELFMKRKIILAGDRTAVEVHDQNLAVESRHPHVVKGHGAAPAKPLESCPGKTADRG